MAIDVCSVLGFANPHETLKRLDLDEVSSIEVSDSLGRFQVTNIISEPGLYALIQGSRKPEARPFQRWVNHEVLPSIRKHGAYMTDNVLDRIISEPEFGIRLLTELKKEREEKQLLAEQNAVLLPKAELHDLFLSADNCQSMNIVAKSLGIGRNILFKVLRDRKILMYNNTPYQEYIDRGYFKVVEKPIIMGGEAINKPQTLVTSKGVDYIAKLLKEKAS